MWRIVAAATALELALIALLAAGLGFLGFASGWLDVLNQMAPIWGVLALLAIACAYAGLRTGGSRRFILILAGGALVFSSLRVVPELAYAAGGLLQPQVAGARFTFATYNVWQNNLDPDATARKIVSTGADVVVLQEVNSFDQFGDKTMRRAYRYKVPCDHPWTCGMTAYSKLPVLGWGWQSPRPGTDDPRALAMLWLKVKAPDGRPVTILTTHYTWPFPPFMQAEQRDVLALQVEKLHAASLIVAGDMNLTPWSYAMGRQDRRFAPLTRRTHAWFSYPYTIAHLGGRVTPFPLLPIDQLYASPDWTMQGIRSIESGSDHTGLMATLVRTGAPKPR